jgi:hypothetical protein
LGKYFSLLKLFIDLFSINNIAINYCPLENLNYATGPCGLVPGFDKHTFSTK